MANKMKIWLAYANTDETYAYEFDGVPDSALIEASVQAAVTNFNNRIKTVYDEMGGFDYGMLFSYDGKKAVGVAKVTAESTHEVPITISGGN